MWCVKCRYGNYGLMRKEPRDLVDDLKVGIGYKLVKGFTMLEQNSKEV